MRARSDALDQAIAAFRDPSLVAELRERSLADEVILVLRVAAGDQAAIAQAQRRTSDSSEQLQEAAIFYLQQALFTPHANAYRVLGCREDAAQQRLRENYRWLIKWLHPDRNVDQWESVYADKVNIAWQALKTPDRRERYNASNGIDGLAIESPAGALAVQGKGPSVAVDDRLRLSGSAVRHLPAITLSVMGLGAAVVLGLIYWANQNNAPTPTLSTAAIAPAINPQTSGREMAITMDPDPAGMHGVDLALDEQALTVAGVLEPPEGAVPEPTAGSDAVGVAQVAAPTPDSALEPAAASRLASVDTAKSGVGAQRDLAVIPPRRASEDAPTLTSAAGPSPDRLASDPRPPVQADSGPTAPRLRPAQSLSTASLAAADAPQVRPPNSAPSNPEPEPKSVASTTPRPVAAQDAVAETAQPALATVARSATVTAPSTPNPEPRVAKLSAPSASQAAALVSDFTAAYTAGDLSRFDGLFSPAAAVPADLSALRERMRDAQLRYLELANLRWELDEEEAIGYADYRETFVPEGERRAITRVGDVQWVIRMNGSQPRIAALNMQAR